MPTPESVVGTLLDADREKLLEAVGPADVTLVLEESGTPVLEDWLIRSD